MNGTIFPYHPRGGVHVLAVVDEASYVARGQYGSRPSGHGARITAAAAAGTALGHTEGSYEEPLFRSHLLGGIQSAAGVPAANCKSP